MNPFLNIKRKLLLRKYKSSPAFGRYFKEVDLNTKVKDAEFVVFDTETSGLNPKRAQLLSVGAIKAKNLSLSLSESLHLFLKPEGEIEPSSVEVHGIRPVELMRKGEPTKDVLERFLSFIKGTVLVGFYTKFDVNVVSRYTLKTFGIPLLNYYLDTFEMYYRLHAKRASLEDIAKELELPSAARHSALDDAYTTALLFLKLTYNSKDSLLRHLPLRL